MNKKLKQDNLIEDVVRECGFGLLVRSDGLYESIDDSSLIVDYQRGRYEWTAKGENGDVIDWLKSRFGWDYKTAIRYLEHRSQIDPLNRPKLSAIHKLLIPNKQVIASPIEARLSFIDWGDSRIINARKLAYDYPGGLDALFRMGTDYAFRELDLRTMNLIPLMGCMESSAVGGFCHMCFADYQQRWLNLDDAFLWVEIDDENRMKIISIICASCVDKTRRHEQALSDLIDYLLELKYSGYRFTGQVE